MKKTSCCCCCCCSPSQSLPMMIFSKKKNSKSTPTSGDSSLFVLAKTTTTARRAVTALRDDEYVSSSLFFFFTHRCFMWSTYIIIYNLREKFWGTKLCNAGKAKAFFICGRKKKIALLSEIFGLGGSQKTQKRAKKNLSFLCCSLEHTLLSLGCFEWSSLFQRINQISLHLLSRTSIALFHKGVFIYQNAVISVILLSSRHRRERERERESRKRKYSLS